MAWGDGPGPPAERRAATGAAGHDRITASISAAGWRAAMDADVAAIIACTNSGATARAISRFRPVAPVGVLD